MIPLPKFLYTTPTPDTERNTPDFQKLSKNSANNKTEDSNGTTKNSVSKIEDSNCIKNSVKIEDPKCAKNSVKIEDPNVTKASIANFGPSESSGACATSTAAKKRKTGVSAMMVMMPPMTKNNSSSEILIQVPADKKESQVFAAGTKNVAAVYETQSKLESDV